MGKPYSWQMEEYGWVRFHPPQCGNLVESTMAWGLGKMLENAHHHQCRARFEGEGSFVFIFSSYVWKEWRDSRLSWEALIAFNSLQEQVRSFWSETFGGGSVILERKDCLKLSKDNRKSFCSYKRCYLQLQDCFQGWIGWIMWETYNFALLPWMHLSLLTDNTVLQRRQKLSNWPTTAWGSSRVPFETQLKIYACYATIITIQTPHYKRNIFFRRIFLEFPLEITIFYINSLVNFWCIHWRISIRNFQ